MTRRTQRGFTLIELIASTALFAVLGTMLFQLITGAMDLWTRGERMRDQQERASAVLDLMTEDLRHVWAGPLGVGEQEAGFRVDWREEDFDSDGAIDRRTAVLRFTRLLHEARSMAWLRHAGETPGAEDVATLVRAEDPSDLLPTGGLAESLFAVVELPDRSLPTLVRRVRTPVGGAGSLLAPELIERGDRLLIDAVPLAERVLYMGVRCWGPDTTIWEASEDISGVPALMTWDSTRGLTAVGEQAFPFGRGPDSAGRDFDDMYPPAVLLELVLDPYESAARASAALAEPAGQSATHLLLTRSSLGGDDRQPDHLWIDGEWVRLLELDGRRAKVERGVRGTLAAEHDALTPVRVGQTFRRVVRLPSARENYER